MPGKSHTFQPQTSNIKMYSIPMAGSLRVTTTPSCSHTRLKHSNMLVLPITTPHTQTSRHNGHYINPTCCAIPQCPIPHHLPTTWATPKPHTSQFRASAVTKKNNICNKSFQTWISNSIRTHKQREASRLGILAKVTPSNLILRNNPHSLSCLLPTTITYPTSIATNDTIRWKELLHLLLNSMARPAL